MGVLEDQFKAANAEMRGMMERAIPGVRAPYPKPTEWASELLDAALEAGERCTHLRRRPVQPAIATMWELLWRCRSCEAAHADAMLAARRAGMWQGLGAIEEFTCDLCRTYIGAALTPMVLRIDLWMLIGGICARCEREGTRHGGLIVKGRAPEGETR